jgi:nucleotide-binding universal stress UspA family protein
MTVEAPNALGVFDRIVCGVDGSREALEAARQAERLRSPNGLLTLTSVVDVDAALHAGWAMSRVLEELDQEVRAALHRAVDEVPSARTKLSAGGITQRLLAEVAEEGATLVALGPRGHSRAAGMLLGGVTTELLHKAPCSVLLARTPRFGEFPSSIIAGVDGSAESLAAAAVAQSIAERFGSELVLVAARGGKSVDGDSLQNLAADLVTDPRHPVDVLAELSKEADLLVVGSRGLHGPRALGSVSERVAHRAAGSVLVVRRQEEES